MIFLSFADTKEIVNQFLFKPIVLSMPIDKIFAYKISVVTKNHLKAFRD